MPCGVQTVLAAYPQIVGDNDETLRDNARAAIHGLLGGQDVPIVEKDDGVFAVVEMGRVVELARSGYIGGAQERT